MSDLAALMAGSAPQHSEAEVQEKLARAVKQKEEGNARVKEGDLTKGLYHYHYALNFVKGLKENGAEAGAGERIEALQVSVWNNMAAVFLAQKRAARAAEVLSSALALEPRNAKARLRAARAYVALRDGERAREHLRAAQAEMPADDRSLATLEAQVRRLEAADERAQAGFFRNMFSAMADEKAEDTDNNSKVDSKVDNSVGAASSEPIVNADGLQEELATLPDDEE